MTRVVKFEKTGDPEVLKLETVNLEKPAPEEVTIEHKAIGLNFIDTYHRSGLYPVDLPSEIGAEGAGVIKEVGSKVEGFSVGDKVAYAGAPLGAYSSERNYPIKNLVKFQRIESLLFKLRIWKQIIFGIRNIHTKKKESFTIFFG